MTQDTATNPLNAPDETTSHRMLAAFDIAAHRMGGRPASSDGPIWGWRGRTISGPVTIGTTVVWMRLASGRAGEITRTFWRGNATAEQQIPTGVPRPRLLQREEWESHPWRYAAETFERVTVQPLGHAPAPFDPLTFAPLSDSWWTDLRAALDAVALVDTSRFTIGPVWAERLLTDYFGTDQASASQWTTCHGDLHWANLAGPDLVMFDWEGWGGGPRGYDAASLLVHSLLHPDLTAQVRDRFADHLDGEHGRYAQQVLVAEQLWRRRDTPDDPLVPALLGHANLLR